MPTATEQLIEALAQGRQYSPAKREDVEALLHAVFDERFNVNDRKHFQVRNVLLKGEDQAAWAGWIPADNPTSGAYQGTSLVWFPGDDGSVLNLCIGTGGFGPDAHVLGRPGHRRRLQALARLHPGRLWVKPDFLDLQGEVPDAVHQDWPSIDSALRTYRNYIYAAVAVRGAEDRNVVEDLIDLYFAEHSVRTKGTVTQRWEQRRSAMLESLFPRHSEEEVAKLLEDRRFVVLQGPPGTGKTRLGLLIAQRYGQPTQVQFHPARTYEDFVIGLAPQTHGDALAFEVRAGDLLRANQAAQSASDGKHVLFIDEINRGDLSRVLGESIYLFEAGEPDRVVDLPHSFHGERQLRLAPGLMVLGTRNTADRSIARIDLAIRRRFAFLDIWPDLGVVAEQDDELARRCFEDTLDTFTEHADDTSLDLVPGHAYFLDPRPDLGAEDRQARVARRLRYELVPLLRSYVEERLMGPATSEVEGLTDRIETRLRNSAT